MQPLPREFYDRDAEAVARDLLGMLLAHRVRGVLRVGRVVEAEAYLGPTTSPPTRSKGRTRRTEVMFGPPGHAYVYLIYGIHHCFNAVTGPGGHASAVLIRALEPVRDVEGNTRGPGLLCRALGIDRACNGLDLLGDDLFLAEPDGRGARSRSTPGPGSGWATPGSGPTRPLRFSIRGNPFVSRR